MIIEYLRPDTIEEAIDLLKRQNPRSIPLGGGTSLAQMRSGESTAVIDLQALGMREIKIKNGFLGIGANVTLQQLHDFLQVPPAFQAAISKEGNFNLRQMATVGGTVASAGGGSPFNALLQAGNAEIIWQPASKSFSFKEFTQDYRINNPGFISEIRIPYTSSYALVSVSRTPLSESIICVCGAVQLDGTSRIVITEASKPIASLLFEGVLNPGEPDPHFIASKWVDKNNKQDKYRREILIELLDRLINELRKEG
jgi:CO/xanthine dehydrogenase FAD-binding subunit